MTDSLYDKYGGFETVSKIVHSLYEKIATSEILQPYFEDVDMQQLMSHQTKFFSSVMGGPIIYDGRQLYKVHESLGITNKAFNELSDLFEEVLEDFNVVQDDINTLLLIIEQARPEVVQSLIETQNFS